jgi:hypothetical protein
MAYVDNNRRKTPDGATHSGLRQSNLTRTRGFPR